jgi:glyoxylase-like metal-dependent hydrolase (beta-lactamase superfamily II)
MYFKQIQQHGDNFSYIIADEETREAVVVDSSYNAGEIIRILKTEKLHLKYLINTHGHSDHTAGNEEMRFNFGVITIAHKLSINKPEVTVEDGDMISVGSVKIRVIHTPGHTPDGICLLVEGKKLLTGDTLFVSECGRTDMAGGDSAKLYNSLFDKLMKLRDDIEVYPGHDYGPRPHSTIGEERKSNYVLQPRTVEEFKAFMGTP